MTHKCLVCSSDLDEGFGHSLECHKCDPEIAYFTYDISNEIVYVSKIFYELTDPECFLRNVSTELVYDFLTRKITCTSLSDRKRIMLKIDEFPKDIFSIEKEDDLILEIEKLHLLA